jgi:ABC-type transport system substrate-binding protein
VRSALLRAIDRPAVVEAAWRGQAVVAAGPVPSVSWAFDPAATPLIGVDRRGARKALIDAGWSDVEDGALAAPGGTEPFAFDLLSPDLATNAPAYLAAAEIAGDWSELGIDVTALPLPPEELVGERLRAGDFAAAVLDINVGLDPDLYPLLGSTQGTSQGVNLSGLVDRELDTLLEAARAPGTETARRKAYRELQVRLAARQYLIPIAFRDELVVVREGLVGPETRQVGSPGDRFWDVLSWRLADDR